MQRRNDGRGRPSHNALSALQSMKILFSCEDFSEKSFASLINRARRRAREAIKPYVFILWMVGITAKGTAIHRTRRRSASPQDRRPTKQAERSGHTNRSQLMPPRFEHEHDAAVATLWRALARGVGRDVGFAKSGRARGRFG